MIAKQTAEEIEILYDGNGVGLLHTTIFFIVIAFLVAVAGLALGAPLSWIVLPSIFIVISVFGALKAHNLRSTFRKDNDVVLETTTILQKKTTTRTIALSEITAVHYNTTYTTKKQANIHEGSSVQLILQDRVNILIDQQWSHKSWKQWQMFFTSETVEPLESEAQALADFLNVPLQTTDLSSITHPFGEGSDVKKPIRTAHRLFAQLFTLAGIGVILWIIYIALNQ